MKTENCKGNEKVPNKRPSGPRSQGGDPQARRIAAAILEVLGGERTPAQAAEALGISVVRYYHLESRALEGFLAACQLKAKGRSQTVERRIGQLDKQVQKLKVECSRKAALLRAAQRAAGLTPVIAPATGKRKRRPTVRALKAARILQAQSSTEQTSPVLGE